MLESLTQLHIEIILGLGVPSVTAAVFVIRHFWAKTKCFVLLKHQVETHQKHSEKVEKQNTKDHEMMLGRLNAIDKNIAAMQAEIKIILNKLG